MMRCSLSLLAIGSTLIHISPVQAASCAAILRSPPPIGFNCGMQGTLKNPALVDPNPTTVASLNACANACEDDQRCISFGYIKASRSCYLYSKTLEQQGYQDRQSRQGFVYYNYHCFACKATATDPGMTPTTSITTIISTDTTATVTTSCITTETTTPDTFSTFIDYVSRDSEALAKRAVRGRPPVTTVTTTTLSPTPVSDISTLTSYTSTSTVISCTTTNTVTFTPPATPTKCGIYFDAYPSASSSGTSITCFPSIPSPSSNARLRIEGLQSGEGTIFEDCIISGPRNVSTPSGGEHPCDGTNYDANDSPGTTLTDQLDAAAKQQSFGYDGEYEAAFEDYSITTISRTSSTSTQFWGILRNLAFPLGGGCMTEILDGQESEWIFDAFNANAFLSVTPVYAIAEAGSGTISITVLGENGGGDPPVAVSGASFAGMLSNSQGNVQFPVPTQPGCYQYKATRSGSAPSNAFYLTVVDSFSD